MYIVITISHFVIWRSFSCLNLLDRLIGCRRKSPTYTKCSESLFQGWHSAASDGFLLRIRMPSSKLYQRGATLLESTHRNMSMVLTSSYFVKIKILCVAYERFLCVVGILFWNLWYLELCIIHDGSVKSTAELQLLLGSIAFPVVVGALLCNPLGRRLVGEDNA